MQINSFKGINNQKAPTEYGLSGMQQALNVDITDAGKVRLRNGKTKLATAVIQSAWSSGEGEILYQVGNTLYLMQNNQSVLSLSIMTGLDITNQLSGYKLNNQLYWSNGVQSGVVKDGVVRTLGIKTPDTPSASQFSGLMPSGRYMYAVTLMNSNGYESGAGLSGLIEVTEGGIDVASPSVEDDNITHANLYLSTANGEVLYHAATVAIGNHLMYAGDTVDLTNVLHYQFCDKPPHFDMATFYRGSMYYVKDNLLIASKAMNFEMVDYANDYIELDSPIQLLEVAESGLYVATQNATYFLSGNTIKDFSSNKVLDYGAIKGTSKRIYASTINPKQAGNVSLWASNRGLIAGFDGGQVANLTDGIFAFNDGTIGTSALREENGLRQLLVTVS